MKYKVITSLILFSVIISSSLFSGCKLSPSLDKPTQGKPTIEVHQVDKTYITPVDINGKSFAYTYNHLDLKNGKLTSNVLATRWTHSFTPDLFAKAYLQWNSADKRFSANFLLDYTYKPRSHIYLVYNENRDTLLNQPRDRIIMLKFTYLWQL